MVNYTPKAQIARAYLMRTYNDIDVFVEDTTCQSMYVRIINTLLGNKGSISTVYPLGSRARVIDECRLHQSPDARKRLYIIDADSDLILGKATEPLQYLCRLNAYSIENHLLTEEGIVNIAIESDTTLSHSNAADRVAFTGLMEDIVDSLLGLFTAYALIAAFKLNIQSVGYPVYRLLDTNSTPPRVIRERVAMRVFRIYREIAATISMSDIRAKVQEIRNRINREPNKTIYISGKHYILPIIRTHLRRSVGFNDSDDSLRVRLSQYYHPNIDPTLKSAVLELVTDVNTT